MICLYHRSPAVTDRSKPHQPLFPAEAAPPPSRPPPRALKRSGGRAHDETLEVSLCDTLPASESIVAALANVADRTLDISPQELSAAAPGVANDARAQAAPSARFDAPSPAEPARGPGKSARRWLWVASALPLLLGGAFFLRESGPFAAPTTDQRAPRSEPAAAERHAKASEPTAGAAIEVVSAPEAAASSALPTAQPRVDTANETSADQAANTVEAHDSVELDPAQRAALTRADRLVAQGDLLRKRRKLGPARSKYRAALRAFPDHARALHGLSQLAIPAARQRSGHARERLK